MVDGVDAAVDGMDGAVDGNAVTDGAVAGGAGTVVILDSALLSCLLFWLRQLTRRMPNLNNSRRACLVQSSKDMPHFHGFLV